RAVQADLCPAGDPAAYAGDRDPPGGWRQDRIRPSFTSLRWWAVRQQRDLAWSPQPDGRAREGGRRQGREVAVLVVVCAERDEAGQRLVAGWPGGRARRLTAGDLSTAGWRVSLPDDDHATAVLDGHRIPVADITAVVVRCPAINAADVPHIASQDRGFVAAEM